MVASVIGIILLIAWIYPAGSFSYSNALDDYRQNPSLDTVNRLCGVSEVYGYRPFFAFTCGRAKSELAFVSNDAQSRLEAMEAYRSALDIDPYWPIHWANLAALEWESGITVQALRHMLIALDSAPNYAVFNFNYGRMLEKGGDFETAQNYYVKAAVLEPSLLSSTKIKHTDELVGHLLASRPFEIETTANYHARIGWYYIHLNQLQDATNEFLIVIDQHHAHASARAGLAYINLKRGAIEEAHKHIRIALFSDPQPGLTQYIAGKIAYLRGNQDEGDSHFRSAIEYYEYETFSEGYYSVVYQEEYLKPDAVPFLQSVFITEQMWLDFYAYVSELDAVEPEKAQHFKEQLRKWKIE